MEHSLTAATWLWLMVPTVGVMVLSLINWLVQKSRARP